MSVGICYGITGFSVIALVLDKITNYEYRYIGNIGNIGLLCTGICMIHVSYKLIKKLDPY